MEKFKVIIETDTELDERARTAIEDAIADALEKIGIKPTSVKVIW